MNNETLFDFEDGRGPVPAHRHSNGGGWVENTAQVEESVFVEDTARVFEYAIVKDEVQVLDFAQVGEGASIHGKSVISGCMKIMGGVNIRNTDIYGYGLITGDLSIGEWD